MKFITATYTGIAAALVLLLSGATEAVLRGGDNKIPHEEFRGIKDWNLENVVKLQQNHHGRDLQSFVDMTDCVQQTGSPALCSCMINDGNPFQYCAVCGNAFVQSNFALTDTANFGNWFTDESVLTLPQTGTYYGEEGITEYVNFIYSELFPSYTPIGPPVPKFLPNPNFASDQTCILTVVGNRHAALSSQFYDNQCIFTSVGSTFHFVPTDANSGWISVKEANVWFPENFLEFIFETLIPENTVEWLCDLIEDSCPDTWAHNNFGNNNNKCKANYHALPKTETDRFAVTGKSLGCKVLHATFAKTNEAHCAHTSFKKQEDPKGQIKCQKVSGVTPEDVFSQGELAFFAHVAENLFGYDAVKLSDESQVNC